MANTPDKPLILDLQQGNLDALGALYDRHRQLVYRTALAITTDDEAAADLLQDVFLRLYRFAGRVDPDRPLEPWLYRVTANLAYTWLKRRHLWLRSLKDMAEWLAREKLPTPHHQAEVDEAWDQVRRALAAIPLQQRLVVVLYYLNDLPIHEIAQILEVPVGTVKSRLHYGRLALKARLEVDGRMVPEAQYEYTA
ncbi:MAG: RNA polymerase sigma factor [Chloroflexota bacterium]